MPNSVLKEALGPVRSVTGGAGSREAPRSSRRGPGGARRGVRCAADAATAGAGWRREGG